MNPGAAGSRRTDFLDGALPRILAHRGLALEAPENTLPAFVAALSAGATHIETDVRASVDGVAVLSHDPDLTRLAGCDLRVDRLSLDALRRVPLDGNHAIASLPEALDAFPDARFNIDVKSDAALEPTARSILDARAVSRVLVTSFSELRRRRAVALLPGVASSASAPLVVRAVAGTRAGVPQLVRWGLRGCVAVQVPERHGAIRIVTPAFINSVHAAGVEVHVWTVDEPADMSRLLDLGVDGLVTDRCDVAAAVVAGRA